MSTVADYAGRTVDLLAFQGGDGRPGDRELRQALADPGTGGMVTAGIQKLAQRVLVVLLTKAGSMPYLPARGTTFMLDAQLGTWRTAADVELSFNSARLDLVRQVRAEARDDDPADEALAAVEFLDASFVAGAAALRFRVVSAAGDALTYITPIPVTIH